MRTGIALVTGVILAAAVFVACGPADINTALSGDTHYVCDPHFESEVKEAIKLYQPYVPYKLSASTTTPARRPLNIVHVIGVADGYQVSRTDKVVCEAGSNGERSAVEIPEYNTIFVGNCDERSLQWVITHEIGHSLGLGHSTKGVMSGSDTLVLDQETIDELQALYGSSDTWNNRS